MAKAPAVVIIARHGARLDAADKSWHLTSPTPYDPPLTYGGWVQSRALGLRIASLLHAREREAEAEAEAEANSSSATSTSSPKPGSSPSQNAHDSVHLDASSETVGKGKEKHRKKKFKVVIHSSPFTRCIQTSVGIGAGLSQFTGLSPSARKGSDTRIKTVSQLHSASPRLQAVENGRSPKLESIPEPLYKSTELREHAKRSSKEKKPDKATLRVDAFLGEWLSPDYFEMIMHPPDSTLMVAGAKADLLRRGESIEHFAPSITPKPVGMWGNPVLSPSPSGSEGMIDDPKQIGRSLLRRDRTNSHSSVGSTGSRGSDGRPSPFRSNSQNRHRQDGTGYSPPLPTYAISPADPIPRGYVYHAKEACVNVDYNWDSMRDPHYWGDGGEYGEEWSSMHKRFRRGLNNMIEWYASDKEVLDNVEGHEDDEDTELVVILVTHGAGCNALIGALTSQPVLIDVGMASLTMAVRKEGASFSAVERKLSPAPEAMSEMRGRPLPIRRNSMDLGLAEVYDMKVVASSEHLRPGVDPSQSPIVQPSSPMLASQTIPEHRKRFGSGAHAAAGAPIESAWNLGEPARQSSMSGPSGMRRGSIATAPAQRMRTYSIAATQQVQRALENMKANTMSSTGLWAPNAGRSSSPGHDLVLDFSNSPNSSLPTSALASRVPSRAPSIKGETNSGEVSPKHAVGAATPRESAEQAEEREEVEREKKNGISDLVTPGSRPPGVLGRSLSQKGLWGSAPSGVVFARERGTPKRRWTVQPE